MYAKTKGEKKMESSVIHVKPIETGSAQLAVVKAENSLVTAEAMVIKDQAMYESAANDVRHIKGRIKELEEKRKGVTKPLDVAKKAVMDLFRKPLELYVKAEQIYKRGMITYTDDQERIRQAQEEKLRKAAAAEEARKKKALEDQARKKEEEARLLREKAAKANAEEKARLEAEAKKKEEQAEAKREKKEDVRVEAPVLAKRTETPKGVSYRDVWAAEVVDKSKLPLQYLEPNMSMLNKMAQATKGKVPIAGVKFSSKKILASR